jgi:Heterokaryon incompatibility protein (HET)
MSSALPTRVLGVSGHVPFLVESQGKYAKYILLSHWWGAKHTLKTTKETIFDMRQGMQIECLPKTCHDTAVIAQRLVIPFLWIDSLCMVQDVTRNLDIVRRLQSWRYTKPAARLIKHVAFPPMSTIPIRTASRAMGYSLHCALKLPSFVLTRATAFLLYSSLW